MWLDRHSERASRWPFAVLPTCDLVAFRSPGHPELGVFHAGCSATTGRRMQVGKLLPPSFPPPSILELEPS